MRQVHFGTHCFVYNFKDRRHICYINIYRIRYIQYFIIYRPRTFSRDNSELFICLETICLRLYSLCVSLMLNSRGSVWLILYIKQLCYSRRASIACEIFSILIIYLRRSNLQIFDVFQTDPLSIKCGMRRGFEN